jgi:hypothetical protein
MAAWLLLLEMVLGVTLEQRLSQLGCSLLSCSLSEALCGHIFSSLFKLCCDANRILGSSSLSGPIPDWLGNATSLTQL